MDNAGYLLAAFTICWAVVFSYVLFLSNKQRGLQREIRALKEAQQENTAE
ncbi:CcmD family protein [Chloroflexota bacterium]